MVVTKQRADRVVLHNISWEQFENLLLDLGDHRSARLAYDYGTIEIMTPLPEHEYYKEVIGDLVKELADELDLDYESLGSTTWRRESSLAGVEADNCFYIQNEAAIRGRLDLDLNQDPPPDLAIEIDVTSKSLPRLPIYSRLGVPEIWCYDSGKLTIYLLEEGEYVEQAKSRVFPELPIQELPSLIERHRADGRRAILRSVRDWARNYF
ncbi:Uma2 family endonuclease [Moorena sp. SIO3H5]|uniref:Uma2 family endonuclease n=1 Tax=Moorena sp. SIO3H5 TaxID=2607834 RepID=UPI0013BD169B|nr:Uma2 family endonuclease [Moorena sp. SIO3H5]NEO69110.1 Uma2 family endonuclease [Moorena sp. SIO3H5]